MIRQLESSPFFSNREKAMQEKRQQFQAEIMEQLEERRSKEVE